MYFWRRNVTLWPAFQVLHKKVSLHCINSTKLIISTPLYATIFSINFIEIDIEYEFVSLFINDTRGLLSDVSYCSYLVVFERFGVFQAL